MKPSTSENSTVIFGMPETLAGLLTFGGIVTLGQTVLKQTNLQHSIQDGLGQVKGAPELIDTLNTHVTRLNLMRSEVVSMADSIPVMQFNTSDTVISANEKINILSNGFQELADHLTSLLINTDEYKEHLEHCFHLETPPDASAFFDNIKKNLERLVQEGAGSVTSEYISEAQQIAEKMRINEQGSEASARIIKELDQHISEHLQNSSAMTTQQAIGLAVIATAITATVVFGVHHTRKYMHDNNNYSQTPDVLINAASHEREGNLIDAETLTRIKGK